MQATPSEDEIIEFEKLLLKLRKNKCFKSYCIEKTINQSSYSQLEEYLDRFIYNKENKNAK